MARRDTHFTKPPSPPTPLAFCVRTLGRIVDQPMHTTLGTFHGDAMLTVVLAGRGRYLSPAGPQPVRAGMVGLVVPGDAVGVLMSDAAEPYDHLYCRFAGDPALALAKRIVAEQGSAFFVHPAWEELAAALGRALGWGGVSMNRDVAELCREDAAVAEALALLAHGPTPAVPPPTADRLLAYVQDHVADPTDLGAMAAHFGYSRSHLCRLARQELGQTVQRVWESAKIDRAKALLAQPALSVAQVAQRVGYRDPAYFSNVFHRATGLRPTAYRAALG